MRISIGSLIVAATIWLPLAATAVEITGRVGALPAVQIQVTLFDTSGTHVARTSTDGSGRFTFQAPPGQYELALEGRYIVGLRSAVVILSERTDLGWIGPWPTTPALVAVLYAWGTAAAHELPGLVETYEKALARDNSWNSCMISFSRALRASAYQLPTHTEARGRALEVFAGEGLPPDLAGRVADGLSQDLVNRETLASDLQQLSQIIPQLREGRQDGLRATNFFQRSRVVRALLQEQAELAQIAGVSFDVESLMNIALRHNFQYVHTMIEAACQ